LRLFLGYGNRCIKHLWAKNVLEHIETMRVIYNSLPENRTQWITLNQINKYGKEMSEVPKEFE